METVQYNNAKTWQISFFALNNVATNLYMFFMMYIAYYATGYVGLATVFFATVATSMRIFDGITDPIIGFFIDKTESKFGKFRPFMLLGNIILALSTLILVKTSHIISPNLIVRAIYFIFIYAIYIIGYTFQTACTKSAQTILTNNPKQRPLFTLFDAVYNGILFIGMALLVTNLVDNKFGGHTIELFDVLLVIVLPLSLVATLLAIISIWKKDVKENWGTGESVRVKPKDYVEVIKKNRPLQMLVISASTDKLALSVKNYTVVSTILFGILIGNYSMAGIFMALTLVPGILITIGGVAYSRKKGLKRAYVDSTWISVGLTVLLFIFMAFIDFSKISLTNWGFETIGFILLSILIGGSSGIGGNIVIPMIADTSDYETAESGRYVPGMISTLFSFVDKLISSFAALIVGIMVASVGFADRMPDIGDAPTNGLKWVVIISFTIIPILGWVASLIAMRWYDLTADKMVEVREKVNEVKAELETSKVLSAEINE